MMKYGWRFLIPLCLLILPSCCYYFGNSWRIKPDRKKERLVERIKSPAFVADTANPILKGWATRELPDWQTDGKVTAPRVMLAKLLLTKDVEKVNGYLANKKPWGKNGTDWAFNPHGDYDFSEVPLVAMLYLFGDNPLLLSPAAKENLVNHLLTHSGNKMHLHTPGTLGIMNETENHIFMGETSRYLKNQWLNEHGDTSHLYNNASNGLNAWWMAWLQQKMERGFFEFNANPYSGYSITALLTFYSFCHNREVKEKCGELLNDVFKRYAYGSLSLRRYPPFRRRLERQKVEKFAEDPLTSIVQTLLVKGEHAPASEFGQHHLHHSLLAFLSSYQLTEETIALLRGNKPDYFIKTGHGHRSCPEIYSGNADYLLSAGGAQRGQISQISVHPTVLFLQDSATELKQCFHLPGLGKPSRWNMTGVYRQFACANHAVMIPANYQPVGEKQGWKVFKPYAKKNFYVLVYNAKRLGLLVVVPETELKATQMLDKLIEQNITTDLHKSIVLPFPESSTIQYNVNARKRNWVIESVNGQAEERNTRNWKY